MTYKMVSPYFEDHWKATRRLTISAGLRFLFNPWSNVQPGYTTAFNPASYNPANAPIVAPNGLLTPTPTYNPANGIIINGRKRHSPESDQRAPVSLGARGRFRP